MDREIARKAIEQSLARGSFTPCTWREDRDVYIDEKSTFLRESLIDPITVTPKKSNFPSERTSELNKFELYAVARSGNSWLVFEPTKSVFALAFGKSSHQLTFHGFFSTDVLAEWLG